MTNSINYYSFVEFLKCQSIMSVLMLVLCTYCILKNHLTVVLYCGITNVMSFGDVGKADDVMLNYKIYIILKKIINTYRHCASIMA